jgi:hypothetical protein
MKTSEKTKRNLTQGAGLLVLFLLAICLMTPMAFLDNKNEKLKINFDEQCFNVWLNTKQNKQPQKISLDSTTYYVTSSQIEGQRFIQIIKSSNPKEVGEEIILIENRNEWIRDNNIFIYDDIKMINVIYEYLKTPDK